MKTPLIFLALTFVCLTACNKSQTPATSTNSAAPIASDPVRQKLLTYAGTPSNDCGRFDVQATEIQLKAASMCAQLANQKKQAFFVAYDMPGMTVGVAGNADGKLFTVQSQGEGPSAALTSGECPSQLRVASSGRVTCFAPGDMGSMSAGHAAGAVAPGMPNPHGSSAKPPSN